MPLSHWDTLAFNADCEPALGMFFHPNGSVVLIEKNQVVLKNDDYAIYLDIEEGTLFLEDMVVTVSKSHDKKSVFVFATYYDDGTEDENVEEEDDKNKEIDDEDDEDEEEIEEIYFHVMAGIGSPGDFDMIDYILKKRNIRLSEKQRNKAILEYKNTSKGNYYLVKFKDKNNKKRYCRYPITEETMALEKQYIGITEKTYKEFIEWLEEVVVQLDSMLIESEGFTYYIDWMSDLYEKTPLRYNQGDALMFNAVELNDIPATFIGKAQRPMIDSLMTTINEK